MSQSFNKLIHFSKTPPPEVVKLLSDTIIGTNGLQYKLLDTPEKVYHLSLPLFIYLQRQEQVIANITFCERLISPGIKHYYLRYFAFAKGLQGIGKKRRGNSSFAKSIAQLFTTDNLNLANPTYGKSIYWAYIDPHNSRSFNNQLKSDFIQIGAFNTLPFSRFYPKKCSAVSIVHSSEKKLVKDLLANQYKDHNFYANTHIFDKNQYYVYKVNGKIVAGLQVHKVHWEIISLPGKFGKALLKICPYIPLINKLINPKDYRFLATEGLFYQAGHENILDDFFEGILHLTNYNSLLFWEDTKSPRLAQHKMQWGWLGKLSKQETPVHVLAKFNGVTSVEIDKIKNRPTYISGFDVT